MLRMFEYGNRDQKDVALFAGLKKAKGKDVLLAI